MKNIRNIIFIAFLAMFGTVLTGCGSNSSNGQQKTEEETVEGAKMEIVLYNDDTGSIFDENKQRICGFELSGGRTGTIRVRTSTDIDLLGTNTHYFYIQGNYVYTEYRDALDENTEKGIPVKRVEKGSEIHFYLIPNKDASNTTENHNIAKQGNWDYQDQTDPMTDEIRHLAVCKSNETKSICGSQTLLLLGLCNVDSNNYVMLSVQSGILRQERLPMAHVRFDDGEVEMWSVMADGETTHHIVEREKFISRLKKSKKCAIKVETQDGRGATYTFNTAGLNWNY